MKFGAGAEPSPAYFNIVMHGANETILGGTELAADWTFSGLQKFGQGLLDRLKGFKLPKTLLEKVRKIDEYFSKIFSFFNIIDPHIYRLT